MTTTKLPRKILNPSILANGTKCLILPALKKKQTDGGLVVPDLAQVDSAYGLLIDVGSHEDSATVCLHGREPGSLVVLFNPQQGSVSFDLAGGRGSFTLIDAEAVLAYCNREDAEDLFGCEFPEFEDEAAATPETDPA